MRVWGGRGEGLVIPSEGLRQGRGKTLEECWGGGLLQHDANKQTTLTVLGLHHYSCVMSAVAI